MQVGANQDLCGDLSQAFELVPQSKSFNLFSMPTEVHHETNQTQTGERSVCKVSPHVKGTSRNCEPIQDTSSYISSNYYLQLLAEKEREIRNLQQQIATKR